MRATVGSNSAPTPHQNVADAVQRVTGHITRPSIPCTPIPPESLRPGQPLAVNLDISRPADNSAPPSVRLHYRYLNPAERWKRHPGSHAARWLLHRDHSR